MKVTYDSKTDLLYIRFDQKKQQITNQRVDENVVLDIGKNHKIIGIEILDASKNVSLDQILPVSLKAA